MSAPSQRRPQFNPALEAAEELLIRTAIRIELPPSLHALAVERFEAIRKHIEREGSPLKNLIRLFYPQGSMAIRATIRSRKRADGYDIDIIAELLLPAGMKPGAVLDLLYAAIKGEKGSRYYDMTRRQSRCVTVEYEDGMHLDVTPSILVSELQPRLSHIFHAKPEEPEALHRRLLINSFAFVEHVKERTPIDLSFADRYAREVKRYVDQQLNIKADADVIDVPDHSTKDGGKSVSIVALQLLKRNRNERYRTRTKGRLPPSVMVSKIAVDAARPGCLLVEAVDVISERLLAELEQAEHLGILIDVRNPTCHDDCFTDRWPENRDAQRLYIDDLKLFRRQLALLVSGELSLPQMRDLLTAMFGEGPAQSAVADLAASMGAAVQNNSRHVGTGTGGIHLAAVAAPAIVTGTSRAAAHSFYGTSWRDSKKR